VAKLLSASFLLLLFLLTPWFWQLIKFNPWFSFLVIFTSLCLFLSLQKEKKALKIVLVLSFIGLFFFQVEHTPKRDLFYLDNTQQGIVQMRTKEYREIGISLFGNYFFPPIGYWLEESPTSVAFYKIKESFFELLDPNLYFFASHPREKVGADEFEKLPLIFLPLLVLGLLTQLKKNPRWFYWIFFIFPVLFLSFWGSRSFLGPFSLLPFLLINIFEGFNYLLKLKTNYDKKK